MGRRVSTEGTAFLELSALLTGFELPDLLGTGMGAAYLEKLEAVIPPRLLERLWHTTAAVLAEHPRESEPRAEAVRRVIWGDPDLGPVARNILKLWYLGVWYPMPAHWRERNGSSTHDLMAVVSARAYQQGLVWPAIGAHPMGAKHPGFASWQLPPPANPLGGRPE